MKILITGAGGMVGHSLVNKILKHKVDIELMSPTRQELNLYNLSYIVDYFSSCKPDMIIHLAAKVGGIDANVSKPVDFFYENSLLNINTLMGALKANIKNFLFIGSSCMYPKDRNILREQDLLTGKLEPTNEGYAISKISGAALCRYISQQYGFLYRTIIPCNLYGPNDNFDLETSHLIPAIITKLHQAKIQKYREVIIWGDGKARREFMFVDDLSNFIFQIIDKLVSLPHETNVGLGYDYSVNEYYQIAAEIIGYKGVFKHDFTKPVGMMKKLLDVSVANHLGWSAKTSIESGLQKTYDYFLSIYG